MNIRKLNRKYFISVLSGFIFIIIILIVFSNQILSKNHPVESKTLVIEGWLASYDLELLLQKVELAKYENIIITGIAHNHPEYVKNNIENEIKKLPAVLYKNGCLIITRQIITKVCSLDSLSKINVYAHGSPAWGEYPNFFVGVNDSIIGNAFVNAKQLTYTFSVHEEAKKIDGIYIYFNNDVMMGNEDRNLIIDSVSLDKFVLDKPSDYFSVYDDQIDDNHYTNFPFYSNALLTTRYLKLLGVKKYMITLDTLFNKRNKTLAAAGKVELFLLANLKNVKSINVVSVDYHSRRSYLAYKIATRNKIEVGIISLDDAVLKNKSQNRTNFINLFEEYVKFFITFIQYLFS